MRPMSLDVRGSIDIARPRPEVFAFMTDLSELPRWLDGVREARPLSPDPTAVGSQVCHTNVFMGQTFQSVFEVLEWRQDEYTVFKVISGPLRGESRQRFDTLDGTGTRVTINVTGGGAGPLKLGNFLAKRAAQRQIDRSLVNVKALLESR
jgi:carbon monoxide dehydrogenase subunit G